ncbi:MAG: glycosyltransferase family 2 protein [Candidatus Lindowbacteria bacterium]|nr:glycosyltransferase family 2 protein [Candidatus Lindowbacteria bacterium]
MTTPNNNRLTFTLWIPVLNEAGPLPEILPEIDPSWIDDILFIDGGSTDNTIEIIKEWGHGRVIHQKEPGIANAYWESLPHINTDVIIAYSPDGNSIASSIPTLRDKMKEGYDMVIASRYLPGAGSDDDDFMTGIGNFIFSNSIRVLFGGNFTDCLVMLRAFRKDLVEKLDMVQHDEPVFETQLAIRSSLHNMNVTEIPVFEPKRIGGVRKMRVFYNGWSIVKLIGREWNRKMRLSLSRGAKFDASRIGE